VATTGVYCRPSCVARLANPKNVRFHATPAEAEAAGFRPCKRCRPDQPSPDSHHAALVAAACRTIEEADEPPSLAALAGAAGLSPFHFHRVFKAIAGVTPKAYAAARRAARVRERLETSRTVTEAIYDAGYNSNSRFYEAANGMLGMTPKAFRSGGTDTEIHFAIGECSLGSFLVATTEKGVCAILIGDDPDALLRALQDQFPQAALVGGDPAFEELVARVVGLVEAPSLGLDLPLDIRGTAFQQRVWQALRQIPAGQTVSYGEIARTETEETTLSRAYRRAPTARVAPGRVSLPRHWREGHRSCRRSARRRGRSPPDRRRQPGGPPSGHGR
jgi:AraC family transcriptional regulator of adaptative response/methylated-DNA-[protein]-cysteine methyltransferase